MNFSSCLCNIADEADSEFSAVNSLSRGSSTRHSSMRSPAAVPSNEDGKTGDKDDEVCHVDFEKPVFECSFDVRFVCMLTNCKHYFQILFFVPTIKPIPFFVIDCNHYLIDT